MNPSDIGATEIAAGTLGTMTLGMVIFLLLQVIKGLVGDSMSGPAAEITVLGVSAFAIGLALVSANANWYDADTFVAWAVGTLSGTVVARGLYSQLFKVSVEGSPPDPDTEVPAAAVTEAQADQPHS